MRLAQLVFGFVGTGFYLEEDGNRLFPSDTIGDIFTDASTVFVRVASPTELLEENREQWIFPYASFPEDGLRGSGPGPGAAFGQVE